jgi:hypothetical protein
MSSTYTPQQQRLIDMHARGTRLARPKRKQAERASWAAILACVLLFLILLCLL